MIDGSTAVKEKVKKRVGNSKLPPQLRESFGNGAAHVASKRSTPDKVAERLGPQLCEKTTQRLAEMGVTIEMEECFREGPFVVLQLQVLRVDARTIQRAQVQGNLEDVSGDTAASNKLFEWCLDIIGSDNQKKLEEEYLPDKVQSKIESKILNVMKEKLERKGVVANVDIVREEKQARYFFEKLKEIGKGTGETAGG